jgi:hypothetical protein
MTDKENAIRRPNYVGKITDGKGKSFCQAVTEGWKLQYIEDILVLFGQPNWVTGKLLFHEILADYWRSFKEQLQMLWIV